MDAPEPDRVRLLRVAREPFAPLSHHEAARRVRTGEFERVRRGVLRPTPIPLERVDRAVRHEERRWRFLDSAMAVAETRKGPVVFAGWAAMAIWNFAVIDDWPDFVELLEPPGSARRSKRGVVIHRSEFDDDEIVRWGDHFVTAPARTLADLARTGAFAAAVVAIDHALSERATPLQRLTKDEIRAVLERHGSARGLARAAAALDFADGRSGSGGESLSRVGIFQLGFEMPELQVRHPHPGGYYDTDFKWPRRERRPPTIGEFDGVMKYLREDLRGGADPGRVVVAEKVREDFLREAGNGFVRWGWAEARRPVPLLRPKLLRAGIRIVRRPLI